MTKIQLPMNKQLKIDAENLAKEKGFSSLQEFIRVALKSFVENRGSVKVSVSSEVEYVTDEMAKKYEKDIKQLKDDLKTGKAKVYTDPDELLADLRKPPKDS